MTYKKSILCVYLFVALVLNATAQAFTQADFDAYYAKVLECARDSGILNVNGNLSILQQAKAELWNHIENKFRHKPHSRYYEARLIYEEDRDVEFSTSKKEEWVEKYNGALNIRTWHKDWEAHHIIPRAYGGTNDWWNIMPLKQDFHRGSGDGIHSSSELRNLFPPQ